MRDTVEILRARVEELEGQFSESSGELELTRALIEGEPWAGAVMRRERDEARVKLEEIAELAGPGWDDSPFGRVESLCADLKEAREERDAARAVIFDMLELYPFCICVCGRAKPRFRDELRERAKKVLGENK